MGKLKLSPEAAQQTVDARGKKQFLTPSDVWRALIAGASRRDLIEVLGLSPSVADAIVKSRRAGSAAPKTGTGRKQPNETNDRLIDLAMELVKQKTPPVVETNYGIVITGGEVSHPTVGAPAITTSGAPLLCGGPSFRLGTGPDLYGSVSDSAAGDCAIKEADIVQKKARAAMDLVTYIRAHPDYPDSVNMTESDFVDDFKSCCLKAVTELRTEMLRRLGDIAKDSKEEMIFNVVMREFDLGWPNNGNGIDDWAPYLRRMGLEVKQRGIDSELQGDTGPKITFLLILGADNQKGSFSCATPSVSCYSENEFGSNTFHWSRKNQHTVIFVPYENAGTEALKLPVVGIRCDDDGVSVEDGSLPKPGTPPEFPDLGKLRNVVIFYDSKASDIEVGKNPNPRPYAVFIGLSQDLNDFAITASIFGDNMRTHQVTAHFHVVP